MTQVIAYVCISAIGMILAIVHAVTAAETMHALGLVAIAAALLSLRNK